MNGDIKKQIINRDISRDRTITVISYSDESVMIFINSSGSSVTLHFDKSDLDIIFDVVRGEPDA